MDAMTKHPDLPRKVPVCSYYLYRTINSIPSYSKNRSNLSDKLYGSPNLGGGLNRNRWTN